MSDEIDVEDSFGEPSEETSSHSRKKRSFRADEWLKIKTLWEAGNTTLVELGEMFERAPTTLSLKLKREGVIKGSRKEEIANRTEKELERDMSRNVGLKVKRANESKEEHYEWARKLSMLTMQTVAKCVRDEEPLSSKKQELLAIKAAFDCVGKGLEQRFLVLGLDKVDVVDESQLPDFNVLEMTEGERIDVVEEAEAMLRMKADDDIDLDEDIEHMPEDADDEIQSRMRQLRSMVEDEQGASNYEKYERVPGHDGD